MTPCVEWAGKRTPQGYGVVIRQGKSWRAHRWVWTQANGPIPEGMYICHACDNPPCVNLDHLFLGTPADNVADATSKGRRPQGWLGSKPEPVRGSAHGLAKLSESDIPVIRARLAGGEQQRVIAKEYGVSWPAIWQIASGRTWRHVA